MRTTRRAKKGRGDSGARQTNYQNAFSFEIEASRHPYLSFNVVNENSAKISAMIQNRTITFDSLQPASSK